MSASVEEQVLHFGGYSFKAYPFMRKAREDQPESEPYVSVPPALLIRDKQRNTWTIGFLRPSRDPHRTGEYEFDVVRNGRSTGEVACRIEYVKGKVRIFGHQGWRTWNGKGFL